MRDAFVYLRCCCLGILCVLWAAVLQLPATATAYRWRQCVSRAVGADVSTCRHRCKTAAAVASVLALSWSSVGLLDASDPARASFRVWRGSAGGSATAISESYLITNYHVIRDDGGPVRYSNSVTGQTGAGQVVCTDNAADLALVQVTGGSLPYVELGDDPQAGQMITMYGYGSRRPESLYAGSSAVLPQNGFISNGVPVLEAGVASVSGDSGGGWFDTSGRLVAVNWGTDAEHKSQATGVSYVKRLLTQCSPNVPVVRVQPGGYGYVQPYGGTVPKQPVSPIQKPDQRPQPQPPQQCQPCQPTEPDYDKISQAVIIAIKQDVELQALLRGPAGPSGPTGPPPDITQLPPLNVELIGPNGEVITRVSKRLGETLKLNLNFKPRPQERAN